MAGEYNSIWTGAEIDDGIQKANDALPKSGGTITGELIVNGGDKAGGSKIVLETGKGQITNSGTQTLFGFMDTTLVVGHNNYRTSLRGNSDRAVYNNKNLAFYNDIPTDYVPTSRTVNGKALTDNISLDASDIGAAESSHTHTIANVTNLQSSLDKKANDFSIQLYNGNAGVNPVKFATVDYSTCNSENGVSAKISMVSGHGNGVSYVFLQDVIINVSHTAAVTVDNFKYYGATVAYDGTRQYGDIFWVVNAAEKLVDFYCLMGQYSRVNMTPWKRLTSSSGGTVTQYTSSTIYSSGTKVWANNDEIATLEDIPTVPDWAKAPNKPSYSASEVGAAEISHNHGYIQDGTVGIKSSDSNEISFASNSNVLYFGYDNRLGSSGLVDTYKFGTHRGAENSTNGRIECGSIDASGRIECGSIDASSGAHISGRYFGSGDDEGLIIGRADNNYAGLILGDSSGVRSVMYLMPDNSATWRYHNGSTTYDIKHPAKAGTIALQSDIGRTTAVNVSDTNYTTLMARGTSLNSTETTPAVNGAISWTYE